MGETEKLQKQKKALYASYTKDGATKKIESDNISQIFKLLNQGELEWMDFSVENMEKESTDIATSLKFSQHLVTTLFANPYSAYEDMETELGLMIPAIRVSKFDVKVYPLLIFVRKNLIVTIHPKEIVRLQKIYRYADIIMKKLPRNLPWVDKLTILLTRIIDENNEKNFNGLRMLEEEGDELGKYLVDPASPRTKIGNEIYSMKHGLITYLNALWESWDVMNSLRYGDAELISDDQKLLQRIGLLRDDISGQISLSEHMSEVLASGLEVLQTIYNNQLQILNNRLAFLATWLAILATAAMVPNTLATVYGIANLSFIDWRLMVISLIFSTLFSGYIMYVILKRKGWLPSKTD